MEGDAAQDELRFVKGGKPAEEPPQLPEEMVTFPAEEENVTFPVDEEEKLTF